MSYLATNDADSTLAVALGGTAGDTTLQIQTADIARFPTINQGGVGDDYTLLTLFSAAGYKEIVRVDRHDNGSSSFTVQRGQEGTAIRTWQVGDGVSLRLTAGVVTQTYTHPSQTTGAHAASAISVVPTGGIAATNVQTALEELDAEKASTGHTHAAGAITFTPSGTLGANNVQAAIQELDDETQTALATKFDSGDGEAIVAAIGSTPVANATNAVNATTTTTQDVADSSTKIASTEFVHDVLDSSFASAAENAAGTVEGKTVDPLGIREALNATGVAPVYGCRAWVNFQGDTAANLAGTYSRSGTTVTVTATAHGHKVGHKVYLNVTSGTVTDGLYSVVSVPDANTFTVTDSASGTTAGNVSLLRRAVSGAGNVSNVVYGNATGLVYINFTQPMPDENYAVGPSASNVTDSGTNSISGGVDLQSNLMNAAWLGLRLRLKGDSVAAADLPRVTVSVFR